MLDAGWAIEGLPIPTRRPTLRQCVPPRAQGPAERKTPQRHTRWVVRTDVCRKHAGCGCEEEGRAKRTTPHRTSSEPGHRTTHNYSADLFTPSGPQISLANLLMTRRPKRPAKHWYRAMVPSNLQATLTTPQPFPRCHRFKGEGRWHTPATMATLASATQKRRRPQRGTLLDTLFTTIFSFTANRQTTATRQRPDRCSSSRTCACIALIINAPPHQYTHTPSRRYLFCSVPAMGIRASNAGRAV